MAYRLRCNSCNHVFNAQYKTACCPRRCHGSSSVSFLGLAVDTAIDVAVACVVADAVGDLLGSAVDSFLDW